MRIAIYETNRPEWTIKYSNGCTGPFVEERFVESLTLITVYFCYFKMARNLDAFFLAILFESGWWGAEKLFALILELQIALSARTEKCWKISLSIRKPNVHSSSVGKTVICIKSGT